MIPHFWMIGLINTIMSSLRLLLAMALLNATFYTG